MLISLDFQLPWDGEESFRRVIRYFGWDSKENRSFRAIGKEKQHNRHFLFNYLAICPIKYPSARPPRISISFVVVLHNKES